MPKKVKKVDVSRCANCEAFEHSMFCSLKHDEETLLSDHKVHNLYKKGQVIFYEGHIPQNLFCIYSGKVKIFKLGEDGKEQIVRFAKKSDVIGYRALFSEENYFASATAIEETVLCCFPKNIIEELLHTNPEFALKVIKLLTSDLRTAEQMVLNMAQKHVRERIAEALLKLKDCYGTDEITGTINSTLTREEIGNIAGTSTETCIRILSELNRDRIIKLIGKRIKIANIQKLQQIANLSE